MRDHLRQITEEKESLRKILVENGIMMEKMLRDSSKNKFDIPLPNQYQSKNELYDENYFEENSQNDEEVNDTFEEYKTN